MPQPSPDHVDVHAFLQQPDSEGVAKSMRRNTPAVRLRVRGAQLSCVTFDDFIDSESR